MLKSEKQFDQIKYQNDYNKTNYDRIGLVVPKGMKDIYKSAADKAGKSLNQFIIDCIEEKLKEGE